MSPPEQVEAPWQRLDPRMLLVHPIREVLRFLPALFGLFVAGSATGGLDLRWQVLGIGVPVAVGLLRYLTTSFRITGSLVELQRGLLNRHVLSTRVERVRTVDVTAPPIHRLLGLTTVRIGTGTASTKDEDRIDLDGLPADRARELRTALLRLTPDPQTPHPHSPDTPVVRLDPTWSRFAPLTSSGFALAAAAVGVASQVVEGLGLFGGIRFDEWNDGLDLPWWALLPTVLALAATISALAIAAYLVTNWGFTLSRDHAGSWHLHRGLVTTRETSLDGERVTGVVVGEPLGLRLAGGARLSAIVTGLGRGQSGSSVLVPPAPRAVIDKVAGRVLGDPCPVAGVLTGHGRRARARRYTRAGGPVGVVATSAGVWVATGGSPWVWVPVALLAAGAAALAEDRARALGHALTQRHIVVRSGSLYRQRQSVTTESVIGWGFRATWFQRRAGLATLVAAIAGGSQSVTALDVPERRAVEVAASAVPGLLDQFLIPAPAPGEG